jgi:hypothetical protein
MLVFISFFFASQQDHPYINIVLFFHVADAEYFAGAAKFLVSNQSFSLSQLSEKIITFNEAR